MNESERERLAREAKAIQKRFEAFEKDGHKAATTLLGITTTGFIAVAGVLLSTGMQWTDSCGVVAGLFLLGSMAAGCVGVWIRRELTIFGGILDFLPIGMGIEAAGNPKIDLPAAKAGMRDISKKMDDSQDELAQDERNTFHVQAWLAGFALAFVIVWVALRIYAPVA